MAPVQAGMMDGQDVQQSYQYRSPSQMYRAHRCNISGCDEEVFDLLLCKTHFDRYITDDIAKKIQAVIAKAVLHTEGVKQKAIRRIFIMAHYIFSVHVPFAEHYPLESLFLYHYRPRALEVARFARKHGGKALTKEQQRYWDWKVEFLKGLRSDFDYPTNELLPNLEFDIVALGGLPSQNEADYRLDRFVRRHILYPPKRFLSAFSLACVLQVVAWFVSVRESFTIVEAINLTLVSIGAVFLAGYGYAYTGLRMIDRIQPVVERAWRGTLYDDTEYNVRFLRYVFRIRAAFTRGRGLMNWLNGFAAAFIAFNVIGSRLWAAHLSPLQLVISALVNFPTLILATSLLMVYHVVVRVAQPVGSMPKQKFHIDLYALDSKMNLSAISDLLLEYLLWNLTFFALILVLGFLLGPYAMLLLVGMWGFFRLRAIVFTLAAFLRLRRDVKSKIQSELRLILHEPFVEARVRYDFLRGLRYRPFDARHIKRVGFFILTTVVIPIAILLVDRHWNELANLAQSLWAKIYHWSN
ncbi:MAG: hypothetical protein ACLP05_11680 [Candidatus Kryptoniota bacterium]